MPSVSARSTAYAITASLNRNTPQKARRPSPSLIDHMAPDDNTFGLENPVQFDEADSDGELGKWLDGKTLIEAAAELGELSDDEDETGRAINVALVNKLPETFSKHSISMKKEMIDTLEPALKRAHLLISHIATDIEQEQFKRDGLIAYDEASDDFDRVLQEQSSEFADAIEESQTKIKAIFEALRVQEERRKGWWDRYAVLIDRTSTTGDAAADDICTSVEKIIGVAEKKFKFAVSDKGVAKGKKGTLDANLLKTMMRGV